MNPNLRAWFRHRIDVHVNGMTATSRPPDTRGFRIYGDVTSDVITVKFESGEMQTYRGGRYSRIKRKGYYAPLMPIREG